MDQEGYYRLCLLPRAGFLKPEDIGAGLSSCKHQTLVLTLTLTLTPTLTTSSSPTDAD